MQFQPIKAPSATSLFEEQLLTQILTGNLQPGDRLPSERQLEQQLQVSRAVINRGLHRLEELHFIDRQPRQGNFVADYQSEGTLTTLDVVVRFRGGNYQPSLLQDIYAARQTIEGDAIELATAKQDQVHLTAAERALRRFENTTDITEQAELIFTFFHELALSSGNQVYALLLNSAKPMYLTLGRWNCEHGGTSKILALNEALLAAIKSGDCIQAKACDGELIQWSLADFFD